MNKNGIQKAEKYGKYSILMFTAVIVALAAAGCGNQTRVITGEPAISGEAADSAAQEQAGFDETKESLPDAGEENSEEGYFFVCNGMELRPDMDAAPVIAALGEAMSYFEAESCAFHGLDKMYTYAGFEIDTYPTDGKDYISGIILKDDSVSTVEGITLSMTKKDMIDTYGEDYTEKSGVCSYERGGMKLCFVFAKEEIRSIEYRSNVLETE